MVSHDRHDPEALHNMQLRQVPAPTDVRSPEGVLLPQLRDATRATGLRLPWNLLRAHAVAIPVRLAPLDAPGGSQDWSS